MCICTCTQCTCTCSMYVVYMYTMYVYMYRICMYMYIVYMYMYTMYVYMYTIFMYMYIVYMYVYMHYMYMYMSILHVHVYSSWVSLIVQSNIRMFCAGGVLLIRKAQQGMLGCSNSNYLSTVHQLLLKLLLNYCSLRIKQLSSIW